MITLFLKNNEINQLKILFILQNGTKVSFSQIQNYVGTPTTTTNRLIQNASELLKEVTKNASFISSENNHFFLENNSLFTTTELTSQIISFLLKDSVPFKIFYIIMKERKINVLELCLTVNISQSYCYSKINEINHTLADYDLSIEKNKNNVYITGSEIKLFYFIFLFQNTEKRIDGLLESNIRSEAIKYLPHLYKIELLNSTHITSINTLVDVVIARKKQINEIQIPSSPDYEILEVLMNSNDIFQNENISSLFSKDVRLYLNFIYRTVIPRIDNYEKRVAIGKRMYLLKENPVILSLRKFIDEFSYIYFNRKGPQKDDSYFETFYTVVLYSIYINIFEVDFKLLFKTLVEYFYSDHSHRTGTIEQKQAEGIIHKYAKLYPHWQPKQMNTFETVMKQIFSGNILNQQPPSFNILLDLSGFIATEDKLKNHLIDYFSAALIRFVYEIEEADLVISDSFLALDKNIPLFIFSDIESGILYQDLLVLIAKEIHQKHLYEINHHTANKSKLNFTHQWI